MKKIINKYGFYCLFLATTGGFFLGSCGSNDKAPEINTQAMLDSVNSVIGVGKVVPEEGWQNIMSSESGILKEILVNKGDEVEENQLLFVLDSQDAQSDYTQNVLELEELKAQHAKDVQNVEIEKAHLSNLQKIWETSKSLYAKNAETLEKLRNDSVAVVEQKAKLEALYEEIKAHEFSRKAKQALVQDNRTKVDDLNIKAPQNGIVTEVFAEVGDFINNQTMLAQMMSSQKTVIEAEVDETLAHKVKVGQTVEFRRVGSREIIGNGKVIFVSPILDNKSILYESLNEADDRRVLRIKVAPENTEGLFVNSKVECLIQVN